MEPAPDSHTSLTRRSLLGGVALLPVAAAPVAAGRPTRELGPPSALTVATWNLYLGVDLFRLFRARSVEDVRRIAGQLLDEVEAHPYDARVGAIADEIAAADADVVALQEAALIRTQRPGDVGETGAEPATDVVVDVLDRLVSALEARGASYRVAASTVTTEAELPADGDDGQVDVRVTDRDALLVRSDLDATDARTGIYEASVNLSLPDTEGEFSLRRGYCLADVGVDGETVTAVSTHLESVAPDVRQEQAAELLDALPDGRPVVLAGDFNSGPRTDTGAYDTLTDSFADAHAALRPDDDGFTCCQASGLANDQSRLTKRVDAVLYRGDVRPTAVERVGEERADRVETEADGEPVAIWPSDHAGVVATLGIGPAPATSTDSATPTGTSVGARTSTPAASETPTETDPESTDGEGPGFGVASALVGLGLAALARSRRE